MKSSSENLCPPGTCPPVHLLSSQTPVLETRGLFTHVLSSLGPQCALPFFLGLPTMRSLWTMVLGRSRRVQDSVFALEPDPRPGESRQ